MRGALLYGLFGLAYKFNIQGLPAIRYSFFGLTLALSLFAFLFITPNVLFAIDKNTTKSECYSLDGSIIADSDSAFIVGTGALQGKNYDKALACLTKAYEIGDSREKTIAAHNLGYYYTEDKVKDIDKAIRWYNIAIEISNDPAAIYGLAVVYEDKLKDYPKAIELYEKAYKVGNKTSDYDKASEAAYSLGLLYKQTLKDYPNALKWYKNSANTGNKNAAYALGLLYDDILKDYPNAIEWYEMAHKWKDDKAAYALGLLYDDILKDYLNALKWYGIAIKDYNNKHFGAMCRVGLLYLDGRGVKKDPTKARSLLQQAADGGSDRAKATLDQLDRLDLNQTK
jgi:TPR repeat protein